MIKTTQEFQTAYKNLNAEQKQAVDTIDGPMLVLAGPGTGKTQLLSARVCNILQKTDVNASNILCLTFTESAASNIRKRLREFMGEEAYDVTISTYHSFGSEIIKNYSEYFQHISVDRTDDVRLERPIDELSQIQIVENIIRKLPFDSQLLDARYYVKSVVETISDLKKNLITPTQLKDLSHSNLTQIETVQPILDETINRLGGISRKKAELVNQYAMLIKHLSRLEGDLIELSTNELNKSYSEYEETNSSKPLTAWKNTWLHKNEFDNFTLTNRATSEKMLELANVYELYERTLKTDSLYDFDDMILRAIDGITNNNELRFNLQERYQYILLDEFQDTNPSQFALVKIIADHPVHEGRPNIMAVGDDDQAIYAFQGASVGNLQDFLTSFRDVVVVNLTHNYRSHKDVLHVADNIAEQISTRLHKKLNSIDKILLQSNKLLPSSSSIARQEFPSEATEFAWVASKINSLVSSGTNPAEIAVLSPKHNILENLVPFLKKDNIPLSYEKRENILETEIVQGLHLAANLLTALHDSDIAKANEYFPQVLSLPYWRIPTLEIWKINWQFSHHDKNSSWAELALTNPVIAPAVKFYLAVSCGVSSLPLEHVLDILTGSQEVVDGDAKLTSPLKEYYFAPENREHDALSYFESLIHLSTIRAHLRAYQKGTQYQLHLSDFLNFFAMYQAADAVLISSHPISQANNAVQLMTAYKAKGLEFDHVFILHAHDDVWGSSSRGSNNQLSLPPNLAYIRYIGSSDDERLRLLFVAITRARHGLYITSHSQHENGKATTPLKYLCEASGISAHLPLGAQKIITNTPDPVSHASDVETLWSAGRVSLPVNFRDLLSDRLSSYVMSPTHLNTFLDMEYGGPEEFLTKTLLRFPAAPTANSEYGVAIHNTLEWYAQQLGSAHHPPLDLVIGHYDFELDKCYLQDHDRENLRSRGRVVLQKYLSTRREMFRQTAKVEVNFNSEGVVLGDARITGKIDRLEIDSKNKTLRIVDYKTGKPLNKWDASSNSYKYKHQLYFYKFLLEESHTWKGYKVQDARLEFVEPISLTSGEIVPPLMIQFNATEEQELKKLLKIVWDKIQTLDFPSTIKYSKNIQGTKAFERDLLSSDTRSVAG